MSLIAIDFDETIVDNSKKTDGYYPDPFPNAKERIADLRSKGHKIMIFSCNNKSWIEKVLTHYEIKVDYIWDQPKPVYDWLIDDRAIRFDGNWNEIYEEIK